MSSEIYFYLTVPTSGNKYVTVFKSCLLKYNFYVGPVTPLPPPKKKNAPYEIKINEIKTQINMYSL